MNAIWQKIKADITDRPLLSLLVLITVTASSILLTLALTTLTNIEAPYDQTLSDLNGAHVWLYFNRELTSLRDIARIEALTGVAQSTGLRYNILSRVRLGEARVWVSLQAVPLETPAVNRLLVQEGRYLSHDQGELLASKDLDDIYGLTPVDTIGITRQDGKEVDLPVVGLAYNPMWDTYRSKQPPYIYVSEETLCDLFPDDTAWGWSMGLRLKNPDAVDEMVIQIEETFHADIIESYTDWRDVRESAIFDAQIVLVFLGTFSIFAILATVLVIASSIGSVVLSQFRQIGILKAVGFTQSQVLWLYLGQYLILGLIGSALGLIIGFALSPLPLANIEIILNTTFRPPVEPSIIALVLGISLGVVALASLGAAIRGARANIIRSIAVGAEAPRKKASGAVKLAGRLRLPMVLLLGLNDVFAKPFRSFLTGLNLALGVVGIVFGLTLNGTIETYRDNPALIGLVYQAIVTRDHTSDRKTQYLLHQAPGVEAFYGEQVEEVETPTGQSFQLRAVEGDLEAFPFKIDEGRFFRPNTHEAIAGLGLLDWLGLEVGDEITLAFKDKTHRPVTWKIVGQYPEIDNAGQMLMVSLPTIAQTINAEPSTYYLKLNSNSDTGQLRRYLQPRPDADLELTIIDESIATEDIQYLQIAVFALSAILVGIALINVFDTSLLSTQEKSRVIGVLKAVGMTPAQVVSMTNASAGLLGFLATCIGIPLGLVLTQVIMSTASNTYGFGKVNVSLNIFYVIVLIPLAVLVSIAGSTIPGRWAAKLPVVDALRTQ